MKKLFLALILVSGFILNKSWADDIPLNIQDLQGGEINQLDPLLIPDNAVSEARNVWFDDTSMAKKRRGMSKVNTVAIGDSGTIYNQFEFKKSNGTDYHIAVASNTLYYRASGPTFTAFQASMSTTTSITNFEVFMDTLQFCNGVANLQYWDTSKVATTTTAYQPKYLSAWQNRLWIAGDTDEPTALRGSGYLNPFSWTVPVSNAVATDPVLFDINSQDGQKIVWIVKSPNGNLLILKEKSAWEIDGTDRDDFSLRLVSSDIGCTDGGSYAFREGRATWLSTQGFVEYDGNNIKIISIPIQTTVDAIKQLSVASGSFAKLSNSEWNVFLSTSFIDSSSIPGSIRNLFPAESATWGAFTSQSFGTIVRSTTGKYYIPRQTVSSGISCDVMQDGTFLSRNTIDANSISEAGFPDPAYADAPYIKVDSNNKIHLIYWYKGTGNWGIRYSTSTDGVTWSAGEKFGDIGISTGTAITIGATYKLSLDLDSSNNPHVLYTYKTGGGSLKYGIHYYYRTTSWQDGGQIGSASHSYDDPTLMIDSTNRLNIIANEIDFTAPSTESSPDEVYLITASSGALASTSDIETDTGVDFASTTRAAGLNADITSANKIYFVWRETMYTNTTGSWVSKTIESGATRPIIRIGADNLAVVAYMNSTTIRFAKYSTSAAAFTNYTVKSANAGNQLLNLYADSNPILLANSQTTNDSLVYTSTGSYASEVFDTGLNSGLTFDTFQTNQTNADYNLSHYIRSAATSAGTLAASWTSVTANSVPSLSAGRYIQYRVDFSTNVISNNLPILDNAIINYHSSGGSSRLSSMSYKYRVYNAVSVSSGTVLDRTIIYDKNDKWTEHTSAINCTNLINFNNTPYFGSDNGFVYQMDIGNDDSGNPINAYFISKAYSLGVIYFKNMSKLFLIANASGNWDLNIAYYLDKSSTANESFPIDLDQTPGIINYKVPLLKNTPFGTIQFKVYNTDANEPFDLYGVYAQYRLQPLR